MIESVHQRIISATPEAAGELLETLSSPDDQFWHTNLVEPMMLSDGLNPGSDGGHGPVRYQVREHVPGRKVIFEFDPKLGLIGTHSFEILDAHPDADGHPRSMLRHTLRARASGTMRLLWPSLVRPIHDATVEQIFDHLQRTLTGTARPASTPGWIRAIAPRMRSRRVVKADLRPSALVASALPAIDDGDCWTTELLPHDSRNPQDWAAGVFGRSAPGIGFLLRVHDVFARLVGLKTMPDDPPVTGFPLLDRTDDEVLLGVDDAHLDFRVGVRVCEPKVEVTTIVQIHNRLGRVFWALVRPFHPRVTARLLRTTPMPVGPARMVKRPRSVRARARGGLSASES